MKMGNGYAHARFVQLRIKKIFKLKFFTEQFRLIIYTSEIK